MFGLLSACRGTEVSSNPAPARITEPLTLSEQPSSIRIPVSLPLDDLQALINDEVPVELHKIDEPQQVCIKTKSKLLPDVSCRLVGSVTRGPIRLTGKGDQILLTMPVKAFVQARNIGKIFKQETATGAINLTARITLGMKPDWTPTAKVHADYDWTNRLGIDFLGQRITFASKVDPKLKQMLANLERTLPRQLSHLQFRQKVEPLWAKGFTSIRVKTEPLIWVRFTPMQVGFSGYQVEGRRIIVGFSARAKTETIFGERPADPPFTPLPRLMGSLPATGINVHVPVLVRYDLLEKAARNVLVSNDYKSLKVEGGTVDALFHDVKIYGTTDNHVAVGIHLSLRTLGGAISTTGTVWFVAKPELDPEKKMIGISDLALSGQTDSKAFNLLLSVIDTTKIRERITQIARYDFSKDYADGVKKADDWLAEQPFEGFVFKGDLSAMKLMGVRLAPDGFIIDADAKAQAAMTYNPERAKYLVARRRARTVEREALRQAETATQALGKHQTEEQSPR